MRKCRRVRDAASTSCEEGEEASDADKICLVSCSTVAAKSGKRAATLSDNSSPCSKQ